MCQHSWYDKSRRHYGPKPNTRRARGLPKRDKGKKRISKRSHTYNNLPDVEVESWVGPPPDIPKNAKTQEIYVKMYNYYVNEFGESRDKIVAMQNTMAKFRASDIRVAKAIQFTKYLLSCKT